MWLANRWNDYEVIDCSKGEKLERWGKYLLVRPDPQVIWDTPKSEKGWKKMNGHYHRSSKGGGEWEFFDLPKTISGKIRRVQLRAREKEFHGEHGELKTQALAARTTTEGYGHEFADTDFPDLKG